MCCEHGFSIPSQWPDSILPRSFQEKILSLPHFRSKVRGHLRSRSDFSESLGYPHFSQINPTQDAEVPRK